MSILDKENEYRVEHFDFIQYSIRKFCLECKFFVCSFSHAFTFTHIICIQMVLLCFTQQLKINVHMTNYINIFYTNCIIIHLIIRRVLQIGNPYLCNPLNLLFLNSFATQAYRISWTSSTWGYIVTQNVTVQPRRLLIQAIRYFCN